MNFVTEVKAKKKQFNITIQQGNSKKEYLVSEELFLDFRLVKGKELSDTELKKFLSAYSRDSLYQKTLNYALFKQRCTHDIIEYLKRLGIPEEAYKYYLHKLYLSRILDDESFTKNYINESFDLKLNGPRKIIFELENKKIRKELYQSFIEEISNKRIMENINLLLERKLKSLRPQSVSKTMQTIKQFIVNKGYDYSDIDSAINEHHSLIVTEASEDSALEKDLSYAIRKYAEETKKKHEKIVGYLLRKGYSYHKIKVKMGEYDEEQYD